MSMKETGGEFSGRRVLVTGGSDGIGLAIARVFDAAGAEVALAARSREKLTAAAKGFQRPPRCLPADLGLPGAPAETARNLLEDWPGLDVLVNNAGTAHFLPFAMVDRDDFDVLLNLNVRAPFELTQALLPALLQSRGSVINISSYFADRMMPGRNSTVYSLTKGALDSFTKALAFELGSSGVRVNAIAPGTVETALVKANLEALSPEARESYLASVQAIYPLGRLGRPGDIAPLALFLAGPGAGWITGQIFHADGGLTTN